MLSFFTENWEKKRWPRISKIRAISKPLGNSYAQIPDYLQNILRYYSTYFVSGRHCWGRAAGKLPIMGSKMYLCPMRVLSKGTLREYWEKYPAAELPLRAWHRDATAADWKTPNEVKAQFGNASIIANNRMVFNIKGNDFRLVVEISYLTRIVYVLFIGTHAEYDKINVATL